MALSEPGKTRPRKAGPFSSSGQTSNRTTSVSSLQSTHSNSSIQSHTKSHISHPNIVTGGHRSGGSSSKMPSGVPSSTSHANNTKCHERSRSDVTSVKLSAESSSVTSLPAIKRGVGSNGKLNHTRTLI